jgi:hypothetical protein
LVCGVFLQKGADVGQVVEYFESIVDVLHRGAVDYDVEDVEATGLFLQVPT